MRIKSYNYIHRCYRVARGQWASGPHRFLVWKAGLEYSYLGESLLSPPIPKPSSYTGQCNSGVKNIKFS